jgi:hypothetical protein
MGALGAPSLHDSGFGGFVSPIYDGLAVVGIWGSSKLKEVLNKLRDVGLKVDAAKSFICTHEIEHLGYMLTRGGIKPQQIKGLGNTCAKSTQQCQSIPLNGTILE